MKKNFIIIILLLLAYNANSQELGIKTGTNFAKNNTINKPFNIGVYFTNKFNGKYEFLLSYDFSKNTQQYEAIDLQEQFNGHNITLGMLYVFNLKEKFELKIGASLGYCYYDILYEGINSRWISKFNAHYLGGNILFGVAYKNFLSLPINLELLFAPNYYYNVFQSTESTISLTEKRDDLKFLNLSFGIKYKFNRNK